MFMGQTYIRQGTLQYKVLFFIKFYFCEAWVLIHEFPPFVQKNPGTDQRNDRLSTRLDPIFVEIFPFGRLE
jgi:hypothetical protein